MSRSRYDCAVRDLAFLLLHLLATVARLAGPGGARSVVAESVLLKRQLLILNRSRRRSPNLRLSDRMVAGGPRSQRGRDRGRGSDISVRHPRKRLANLLRRPSGRGMVCDRDVHDAARLMGEDHQHEQ
jgi:hypothetical protein